MKQLWATVALSLLLLAGCSSNAETSKASSDGETIYGNKCSACHGGDLKGAVGPSVLNMSSKYSEQELSKLIENGTERMPGHLLTDAENKVITKWLLEK